MTQRYRSNCILEREREYVESLRSRYSRRKSLAGVLLVEMETAPTLEARTQAAALFGMIGGRIGLRRLGRLVEQLRAVVEAQTDEWIGPPERSMLYNILFAVANMDSVRSHALLERLLRESPSHLVRDEVLEAMAFETERFDLDLVLSFASFDRSTPEILSALYALDFSGYANLRPDEARERLVPFLGHAYPTTGAYAIGVLMKNPANLELIQSYADDPNPRIRDAVEEAVKYIEKS